MPLWSTQLKHDATDAPLTVARLQPLYFSHSSLIDTMFNWRRLNRFLSSFYSETLLSHYTWSDTSIELTSATIINASAPYECWLVFHWCISHEETWTFVSFIKYVEKKVQHYVYDMRVLLTIPIWKKNGFSRWSASCYRSVLFLIFIIFKKF